LKSVTAGVYSIGNQTQIAPKLGLLPLKNRETNKKQNSGHSLVSARHVHLSFLTDPSRTGFAWQGFGSGGAAGELPEAPPMSNRPSASQPQDGPAAGRGQAHQQWWSASGIMYFRSGKTCATAIAARERSEMM